MLRRNGEGWAEERPEGELGSGKGFRRSEGVGWRGVEGVGRREGI
jgi:hypothetical protein